MYYPRVYEMLTNGNQTEKLGANNPKDLDPSYKIGIVLEGINSVL